MARTSIGPYLITGVLGKGGMGVVFAAVHTQIKRRVAIKLLRPEYASNPDTVARFFHEALAVNVIEHPGLVQVYDHGHLADGSTYLVMEYLHGETLTERLKHHQKPMNEASAVSLSLQLASALEAAHSHGIVHRDLKPANIMLVADPAMPDGERVKLLDFGIAKLADGVADTNRPRTRAGMILGTPKYMAPEQCRGLSDIDGKADVYSLGVLLYQLLSGRLPFAGDGDFDVIAKHLSESAPPLSNLRPQLSTPLVHLVHRMLEKARVNRPSMGEVFAELKRIRDEWLSRLASNNILVPQAVVAVSVPPVLPSTVPPQDAGVVGGVAEPTKNDQIDVTKASKGLARRQINRDNRPAAPLSPVPYVRKRARMMLLPIIDGAVPASPGAAPSTIIPEPSTLTLQTRRRWGILAGGVVVTLLISAVPLIVKRPGMLRSLRSMLSRSRPAPTTAPAPARIDPPGADKANSQPVADTPPIARSLPVQDPSAAPPVEPIQPAVPPSKPLRSLTSLPPLRGGTETQKSEQVASAPPTQAPVIQTECELAEGKAYELKMASQHAAAYLAFDKAYQLCQKPYLIAECGHSMQATGDLDKAVQLYEKYLAMAPAADGEKKAHIQALLQETLAKGCKKENDLAQGLVGTDNYEKIEETLDLAFKFCRDANVYLNYGRALRQSGQSLFAISMFKRCLANDTGSVDRDQVNQLMDEAQQAIDVVQKPKPPVEQTGLHNPFPAATP